MQVKLCFFFLFFVSFLTSVAETSFPTCRVLKPPPLHHVLPLKPCKSCCHHCRHTNKDMFFLFLFFVPFLTNVTETLFTPHAGSSTPHLSTTLSLPPYPTPQASQVPTATAASPHASHDLCLPPFATHKSPATTLSRCARLTITLLQCHPNMVCKPNFDANPPCENLTMAPPQCSKQVLPQCASPTMTPLCTPSPALFTSYSSTS